MFAIMQPTPLNAQVPPFSSLLESGILLSSSLDDPFSAWETVALSKGYVYVWYSPSIPNGMATKLCDKNGILNISFRGLFRE